MGFPMLDGGARRRLGQAGLIAIMLGGGLLYAGISQAEGVGAPDMQAERSAELVAASGGPASPEHLIVFQKDQDAAASVEVRPDDVAAAEVGSAQDHAGGSASAGAQLAAADGLPPAALAGAARVTPGRR